MERRLQAAEALLARVSGQDALDTAIRAAELYMTAAAQTSTKSEANRHRRRCQELIAYAEVLKTELAVPQSVEDAVLKGASRLHGCFFPPWDKDPNDAAFELGERAQAFTDEADFSLSATQAETFDGWKRPQELLEQRGSKLEDVDLDTELFQTKNQPCDLVQDITTDCSVVAGLSAAVNVLTGKHALLSSIFFPFDHNRGRPRYSPLGKYVIRLNFNGCLRKVTIDDRLPTSNSDRALYVVDRMNESLLWPALLEKAYLKIRGGYDFPGSNSGTDLWVLTGWIPEQVFLQRDEVDINHIWARIKAAHDAEDVVITIGTGVTSPEEERIAGLVGEHDYSVQGLAEVDGRRWLLVKNPWCVGPVWAGGWLTANPASLASSPGAGEGPQLQQPEATEQNTNAVWVSLEDVAQNFESMYLNWNPKLFPHRQECHFKWEMPQAHLKTALAENPQYAISSAKGGLVWILASRHFQDAEHRILQGRTSHGDTMAAAARQLGFMSILVFDSGGKRVQITGEQTYEGPYVDSPQTLARLDITAGKVYTVVLAQDDFPLPKYTFTLSVFSQNLVEMRPAVDTMSHRREEIGAWTRRSAGGNAACTTYFSNPQYRLSVPRPTPISILLSTDSRDIPIHVDLVWGHGKRVSSVRVRDVVVSSGEYRRGHVVAEAPLVDAGDYTIVCSTFEAGQQAGFGLRVSSDVSVTVTPIPADAAGRLRTPLAPLTLSESVQQRRLPIYAEWLTKTTAAASQGGVSHGHGGSLLIRLSVVHGTGPNQVVLAVSGDGEFLDPRVAIRTPGFDIEPRRAHAEGMWLVIEGIGMHKDGHLLKAELFSDSPVQVGVWEDC